MPPRPYGVVGELRASLTVPVPDVGDVTADPTAALWVVLLGLLLGTGATLFFVVRQQVATKSVVGVDASMQELLRSIERNQSFFHEKIEHLLRADKEFTEKGWRTLPEDIGTASQLTAKIRELEHADRALLSASDLAKEAMARNEEEHRRIIATIDELKQLLRDHDAWERSVDARHGEWQRIKRQSVRPEGPDDA